MQTQVLLLNFVERFNLNHMQIMANLEEALFPDDAWSFTTIVELLQQSINKVILAFLHDELVGYCLYQVVFDMAEILRIGIAPNYQQQGYAQQLLHYVLTNLAKHNVASVILEVRKNNDAALALYKKNEFQMIHVRKDYYRQKDGKTIDAIILQKLLVS